VCQQPAALQGCRMASRCKEVQHWAHYGPAKVTTGCRQVCWCHQAARAGVDLAYSHMDSVSVSSTLASNQASGSRLTESTMLLYSARRVSMGQLWMTPSTTSGSGVLQLLLCISGLKNTCGEGGGGVSAADVQLRNQPYLQCEYAACQGGGMWVSAACVCEAGAVGCG
jgi:hypothetical protein